VVTTTTPHAITTRQTATPAVSVSPSAIENTAASAPSVEAIGATTPTLPRCTARYIIESPAAEPAPASTAQAQAWPVACCGRPEAGASTASAPSPSSIT
jgi:hypothetical protein